MSVCAALVGPIEWWWDTPEEPNRFMSSEAVRYRAHRDDLWPFLVEHNILCYRPWEAFKGPWDKRFQVHNDVMVRLSDVLVNMNPGVPAWGTAGEVVLGRALLKPIFSCPPGSDFNKLLAQIKETV